MRYKKSKETASAALEISKNLNLYESLSVIYCMLFEIVYDLQQRNVKILNKILTALANGRTV